jgi:Ca2+-binding EF-hand superfamily protein
MMKHRIGAFDAEEMPEEEDQSMSGENFSMSRYYYSECVSFSGLRLAFSLFDKDHDGFITLEQVMSVMYALGHTVSKDKLEELFKMVDLDGQC